MFIRVKMVDSNEYFYLAQTQRVEGKPHPVQRVIEYLGSREAARVRLAHILHHVRLISSP